MVLLEAAIIGGVLYLAETVHTATSQDAKDREYVQQFDTVTGRRIPQPQPPRQVHLRRQRGHLTAYNELQESSARAAERPFRQNLPHRISLPTSVDAYKNGIPMARPDPYYEPQEVMNRTYDISANQYMRGLTGTHDVTYRSLQYNPSKIGGFGAGDPSVTADGRVIGHDIVPEGRRVAPLNPLEKREQHYQSQKDALRRMSQSKTDTFGTETLRAWKPTRKQAGSDIVNLDGHLPSQMALIGEFAPSTSRRLHDKPQQAIPQLSKDFNVSGVSDLNKHGAMTGCRVNSTRLLSVSRGTLRNELPDLSHFERSGGPSDSRTMYHIGTTKKNPNLPWGGNTFYNAKASTEFNATPSVYGYYENMNKPNVVNRTMVTRREIRGTSVSKDMDIDASRDFKYTRLMRETMPGKYMRPVQTYDTVSSQGALGTNARSSFTEDKKYRDMEAEMESISGLSFAPGQARTTDDFVQSSSVTRKLPIMPVYVSGV